MNDLIQYAGPAVTVAGAIINFAWSAVNLRLARAMEKRFVTRQEFRAEQRVNEIRHTEVTGRLERAGA